MGEIGAGSDQDKVVPDDILDQLLKIDQSSSYDDRRSVAKVAIDNDKWN